MTDHAFFPAAKLARMLRARSIGCVELLDHYLSRIARHGARINAVIAQRQEFAREAARAADDLPAGAPRPPLFGLPMTIKESFDVTGMATTWGLPEYAQHRAAHDALAVRRLSDAGAIVFGKTNVPVLLSDWQSFNPVYGTTNNPWDTGRTPGGSSGGSAAALAAGFTALEFGSDIGASIRNPAHYCGVFGHKPTYGIVAGNGQALDGALAEPDIAVVGPLARSAEDLALALKATMGADDIDGTGWRLALPRPRWKKAAELRVAVMLTHATADVDASVQQCIDEVARFLEAEGARVDRQARPAIDPFEAHTVYLRLLRFATAGRQDPEQHRRFMDLRTRLADDDHSYFAELVRGTTLAPREWHALDERRHRMRHAWARFFQDWDVLLCPTAATAAFPHMQEGERWERLIPVNGQPQPSTTQLFWAGFPGMCLLPSTVAPAGLTADGLPVGVQIVGPQYGDLSTIAVARLIERGYRSFVAPPGM